MSWFDFIKNKISKASRDADQHHLPFLHEPLERKQEEKEAFKNWQESHQRQQMLDFIDHQYQLALKEQGDGAMFRMMKGNTSNGFMLRYPTGISSGDFTHLFDFLKERIRSMGYVVYTSDRRIYDRPEYVETIDRHYLKPSIKAKLRMEENKEKFGQLYGNVHIELYKVDDRPTHIRFLCHNYQDHKFYDALDFRELIERLCAA